ncbi:MAG TPA: hypothetical protein PKZ83_17975 [bacterium]|nr:hypothetical protein [bacterium]HQJ66532.1 hypothetical protein [bacterium]
MKRQAPFWMVYVRGNRIPVFEHKNREAAEREAQRIAIKEGKETFVLTPIGGYFPNPEPIFITDCKGE